ncbi:hypothetical protein TELCIR_19041, partial [Teladorsagia circumcincta]
MLEIDDTPGGVGSVESSLLDQSMNSSTVPVNQIELGEEETVEPPVSAESVLDRLSKFPYQVFVLSEYGRPIFVSYMDSSVSAWRTDISLLQSAIRVLPMQPSDRDYLSSTMVSCLTAAKLDGVLFGLMIAHRQVAAMVKKKIVEKLESNAKFFPSFQSSIESPVAFSISQ